MPCSQLGPYEIIGLLGVGGMGKAYRARETKLNREVALKVYNSQRMGSHRSPPTRSAVRHTMPNSGRMQLLGATKQKHDPRLTIREE